MAVRTRAGIELIGSVLRYAAIAEEDTYRLLRLGRCDFDFDISELLLKENPTEELGAVAEAVEEAFSGTQIGHHHLVLYPPVSMAFMAPVAGGASPIERNQQLHWQAGELLGADADTFKIIVHPVRSETHPTAGAVDWFSVTVIRRPVHENLLALVEQVQAETAVHFTSSTHAASTVAAARFSKLEKRAADSAPVLMVGQYPDHYEYTLSQEGSWQTSCYDHNSNAGDVAYTALRMLKRFDVSPKALDDLLLYGPALKDETLTVLEPAVEIKAKRLNPFEAAGINLGAGQNDFAYWEYVTSIGVTL